MNMVYRVRFIPVPVVSGSESFRFRFISVPCYSGSFRFESIDSESGPKLHAFHVLGGSDFCISFLGMGGPRA